MADVHCQDNANDRALGDRAERAFCRLAAEYGKTFTAHQIGRGNAANAIRFLGRYRTVLLPDITLWTAPGEHHEIKHKAPHDGKYFGLEEYRLTPLKLFADETQQKVYYTIHRHDLAGGRNNIDSNPEHWFTANICELWDATLSGAAKSVTFSSWVNGRRSAGRLRGWFWPTELWVPLIDIWLPDYDEDEE